MSNPGRWTDLSLLELARAVHGPTVVPGSGSAAAALGALGAALAAKALRGRGREPSEQVSALKRALEELCLGVDRDAEAYRAFHGAPAGTPAWNAAQLASIEVPTRIAEQALAALERLAACVTDVPPRLSSEAHTGAAALLACVEGATYTARANWTGALGSPEHAARRGELRAMAERARQLAHAVREHAETHLDPP